MGTDKITFEEELWGATGSDRKWRQSLDRKL